MAGSQVLRFQLSPETKRYLERADRQFGREAMYGRVDRLFGREATRTASAVSQGLKSGEFGLRSKRDLRRSIIGQAERVGGTPAIRVGVFSGPALAYAGVQEFGTTGKNPDSPIPTIRPKNAKALAQPVGKALTAGGDAKYRSPREYPGELQFVPFAHSGSGIGGLYDKLSLERVQKAAQRTKQPVDLSKANLLFILRAKTDIPAHHYLQLGTLRRLPAVAIALSADLAAMLRGEGAA